MAALAAANKGHAAAYGADPWTSRAEAALRRHFGPLAISFLVFNGSGANVLAMRAACRSWEAVICAHSAHANLDEGGAPERLAGVKLLAAQTPDGKLRPEQVHGLVTRVGDQHAVQPRLVTLTQSTELGTRYRPREMAALADSAHAHGLLVHVDGARLANAAAGLGTGLGAITTDVGVDIVSLGGTKNGMMLGEAVVILNPALAEGFRHLRKQTLQLASKGRFLAAQFVAMYEGDLWWRNADHANAMALRLAAGMSGSSAVTITQEVQANAVFALLPPATAARVRATWPFHTWDQRSGEARLMCSWDTTPEEVDAFAAAIADAGD